MSFFFQAEAGIRDRSPSRGLGDVYKRQTKALTILPPPMSSIPSTRPRREFRSPITSPMYSSGMVTSTFMIGSSSTGACLLYTSDAADEEDSVDLGGRRRIKKKQKKEKKK